MQLAAQWFAEVSQDAVLLASSGDLDKMLDDYYDERGWDIKKGVPAKQKLVELELQELV